MADPHASRNALAQSAYKVVQWAQREEERIFIIGGAVRICLRLGRAVKMAYWWCRFSRKVLIITGKCKRMTWIITMRFQTLHPDFALLLSSSYRLNPKYSQSSEPLHPLQLLK